MSSLVDTLKGLGPARLAVLGGVFLGLIVFLLFVSAQVSRPTMSMLYADLSSVDSAAVAGKLEAVKIPFSVSVDGKEISVPKNEIGRARMLLAQEGLPNGGSMGYEIFDQQSGFGTTSFVQNVNQVRALQGELARTISTLEQVEFAKVLLVLPQRRMFSRENMASSASVTIKMRQGARLDREQIFGIQNLVANAVPDLKPDRVTIVDTEANLLGGGNREDQNESASGIKAQEMRLAYEQRLNGTIEDIVGRIVGFNNVRAHVTADLNFDRITTNSEIYDPESQVARSVQTSEETAADGAAAVSGGDVSVANNIPGGNGTTDSGTTSSKSNKTDETTNFEISRTVKSVVSEVGEVKKLSVAVVIDGTYTTDKDGKQVYAPRKQEELDQIATLVRSAIGYDEKRGDVVEIVNLPFKDEEVLDAVDDTKIFGFERSILLDTVEMVMLGIMGILVLLLVIKPIMTSLITAQKNATDAVQRDMLLAQGANTPALSGPGMGSNPMPTEEEAEESLIDMQAVEGKVKASAVKKVGDIVSNHPTETVSILRNWMTQES